MKCMQQREVKGKYIQGDGNNEKKEGRGGVNEGDRGLVWSGLGSCEVFSVY